MEDIRYFIIVEGMVQNVGFRVYAQLLALNNNITGYAKNLSNGMVEICAQGRKDNLQNFIKEIKVGNRFIKITNMSIKEIPPVLTEKKFITL